MSDRTLSSLHDSLHRVKLLLQKKQFSNALKLCDCILDKNYKSALTHQFRGEILAELNQFNDAISAYQTAIDLDEDRSEPYAYLGELYDRHHQFDRAVYFYKQAIKRCPDWQALHYNLARVLFKQGDGATAKYHYDRAIALDANDAKAHYDLGLIFDGWGQLDRARYHYQKAVELNPHAFNPRNNLGSVLLKQNRPHDALNCFRDALNQFGDRAGLHNNLGRTYYALDRLDLAIASYLKAIQLDSNFALAHENLGKAFDRQQQPAAALACFQKASELDSDNLNLYGYCSWMWLRLDSPVETLGERLENAITTLQQAIDKSSPRDRQWLQNLLQREVPDRNDPYEIAWKTRRQVLRDLLHQSSPDRTARSIARLYQAWGDTRLAYDSFLEAEAYYEIALRIDPENMDAERGLGAARTRIQRRREQIDRTRKHRVFPIPEGLYPTVKAWLTSRYSHPSNPSYQGGLWGDVSETIRGHRERPPHHDLSQCDGINCKPCLRRIHQIYAPIGLSQNLYHCSAETTLPDIALDTFTADIPQGRIWAMPQSSWWKVCEAIAVMSPDNNLLADVSREYPGELPGCDNAATNRSQHRIFTKHTLPALETVNGTVAVLCGLSANVYFHWMVDILPRLDILRRSGFPEGEIDWFYVNSIDKPFQQQTLELLGVPLQKVIESDRHPHLQATRLVVPSFPSHIGWATPQSIDFLRSTFLPLAEATPPPLFSTQRSHDFLRSTFLPLAEATPPPLFSTQRSQPENELPERIYISRQQAKYRKIVNEAEIIDCLNVYGFVPVALENYSIAEQVRWFANAKAIVAPHGAGLTNLVFCQTGAISIELFSPNYIRYYYWSIGRYLQLDHYYIVGKSFRCDPLRQLLYPDSLTEDFWVEVETLKKLLDRLFS
ncbi:tetratricopeptide repeat protein [Baaleninema simplex]|uniref:tetratricopeptide repeat protein n=1 Tax=Baaleninema simplex TaxID=2862350 RepID=UPI000344A7A1|nr:tetratricopeptide repeat protein [Baaleninema simplex]